MKFDALGENGAAAAFIFQWQDGSFSQVLPLGLTGSVAILATKPPGPAEDLSALVLGAAASGSKFWKSQKCCGIRSYRIYLNLYS